MQQVPQNRVIEFTTDRIYIPTSLSILIDDIADIKVKEKTASLTFKATFIFLVEGLKEEVINALKTGFKIQVCRHEAIDIIPDHSSVICRESEDSSSPKQIVFTAEKTATIDANPGWMQFHPFDYLDFCLEINVVDKIIELGKTYQSGIEENVTSVHRATQVAQLPSKPLSDGTITLCFDLYLPINTENPLVNPPDSVNTTVSSSPTKRSLIHQDGPPSLPKSYNPPPYKQEVNAFLLRRLDFRNSITVDGFDVLYKPDESYNTISYESKTDTYAVSKNPKALRITSNNYLTFHIYAWRSPLGVILKYISPIIVIEFVLLSTLTQEDDVGSKVSNITTALLALFAFFPTFKEETPHVDAITITESIIYAAILMGGLVLLAAVVYPMAETLLIVLSLILCFYCILALIGPLLVNRWKRYRNVSMFNWGVKNDENFNEDENSEHETSQDENVEEKKWISNTQIKLYQRKALPINYFGGIIRKVTANNVMTS